MREIRIEPHGILYSHADATVTFINKKQASAEGLSGELASISRQAELPAARESSMEREIGSVEITPQPYMPRKHLINVVLPEWNECEHFGIGEMISRSLLLAAENECASVAIPLPSKRILPHVRDAVWNSIIVACSGFFDSYPEAQIDIVLALDKSWLSYRAMDMLSFYGAFDHMNVRAIQRSIADLNFEIDEILYEHVMNISDGAYGFFFSEVPAPASSDIDLMRPEDTRTELRESIDQMFATGPGDFPDDDWIVADLLEETIMRTLEQFNAQINILGMQGIYRYGEYAEESWMHYPEERLLCQVRLQDPGDCWYFFWYIYCE